MTLAEAVYARSNSRGGELQPYRPHQPPTSKEAREKRSPGQTGFSDLAHALRFGRFRLVLRSRELLAGEIPLSVGNRAMDVLFALIEAQGLLVTKDELLSRVWPNTTVEENNLQFQISTLRKVLGEDRDLIRTVSGRGYRFVAEVTAEYRPLRPALENASLGEQDAVISRMRGLSDPETLAEAAPDSVGREAHVKNIGAETAASRSVALAGTDGISKMRLAFELARRAVPTFAKDMVVSECGRVLDSELVPATVATASGLDSASKALERTAASLNSKHLLLLLESCEHLIETVASVAEALLQANVEP